ncbi:hypothetical protein [Brachybacterium sp. GPGPB12]
MIRRLSAQVDDHLRELVLGSGGAAQLWAYARGPKPRTTSRCS